MEENNEKLNNEEKSEAKTIQQNVLAAIKAGQVHMKPRWYFVLQAGLFIVGLILVFIAALFIGSFFLFTLHQNGTWFTPAFGSEGIKELFSALSVGFVIAATLFIMLLQILVRKYSFAYGKPVLFTVLGVVVLVVGGSFLIQSSHVHESLLYEAREHKLPVAGILYRQFAEPDNPRVTPGVVIEIDEKAFLMRDPHDKTVTVILTPVTKVARGTDLEVNDKVVVLGNRQGDNIMAEGIRELYDNDRYFPPSEEQ